MARTITSKKTPQNDRLSASLIFTSKEMKQYTRYQRQTLRVTRGDIGKLPTATQYAEFQTWRDQQRRLTSESALFPDPFSFSADFSAHLRGGASGDTESSSDSDNENRLQIATTCKHALHPASAVTECARCHCCVIDTHIEYMAKLTKALDRTDACDRWRMQPGTEEAMVYQAWYSGKLDLVKTVYRLEGIAAVESMWQELHPEASLLEVMSAEKALSLYWTRNEDAQWPAGGPEKKRETTNGVRFDEETNFEAGRPEWYFRRTSAHYEPGKYSFEEEEECISEFDVDEDFSAFKFGKRDQTGSPTAEGYEMVDGEDEEDDDDDVEEVDEWREAIEAEADYIVFGDD